MRFDYKEVMMLEQLNRVFDWFIAEEIQQEINQYSRAKMIVGIGLLIGSIIALQSLRSFLITVDLKVAFVIVFFSLLAISGPFVLKFTKSIPLAASLTTTSLFLLVISVVCMRGGISSSIASYIALVSIIALMMSGFKAGLIWGILSILALVAIYNLKNMGVQFPDSGIPPEKMENYLFLTYTALTLFTLLLGLIYEKTSDGNFLRFKTSQQRSDEITAQLQEALESVNAVMESVSRNDLSQRITCQLEGNLEIMKHSVNNSIELLRQTIDNASQTSEQISRNSTTLSTSAQELARGTATQASSLEEIASSMNEIDSLSRRNNENAKQSQGLTGNTLEIVNHGALKMEEMVETMREIADTGQNVTKVVKTIDEIAFQTNLLALNAAVEAARAGKYGKGFSVVAEEVRNLASRSADAAKDTTILIETTMRKMEDGVQKVDATSEILTQIMQSVEKVNGLVDEITIGSDEQRKGIEEMTRALNQVNDVVQQNASISDQTAMASEQLDSQSQELLVTMRNFVT